MMGAAAGFGFYMDHLPMGPRSFGRGMKRATPQVAGSKLVDALMFLDQLAEGILGG